MTSSVERELKLIPSDPALLDMLASVDVLGDFAVRGRRHEEQRNSFFDTATQALARARIGFRRRTVSGQRLATWTIKADGLHSGGVAIRTEIELHLDPAMPPVLALSALRQAARQRGAAVLADVLGGADATDRLLLAQPYLELDTRRALVDLHTPARRWQLELALDRVRMPGHDYSELEIEAELKHGDDAALNAVRTAIEALGAVRESDGSKLSRARTHLERCTCLRT